LIEVYKILTDKYEIKLTSTWNDRRTAKPEDTA